VRTIETNYFETSMTTLVGLYLHPYHMRISIHANSPLVFLRTMCINTDELLYHLRHILQSCTYDTNMCGVDYDPVCIQSVIRWTSLLSKRSFDNLSRNDTTTMQVTITFFDNDSRVEYRHLMNIKANELHL
jgi:hypothetical protein